jgi:hypothetical protein
MLTSGKNIAGMEYLKAALMFLPIFFYAPFFFSEVVNAPLRISHFFLLSACLFFTNKNYSRNDLSISFAMLILILLMIFSNEMGVAGFFTIGNYSLTMVFGWALSRYMATSRCRSEIVLALYVNFFYLSAICSSLSVFYFIAFGEFDFFGIKSDIYTHLVTPWGVLLEKNFGYLTVYRSFFFFREPVYIGVFSAINIFFIAPLIKEKSKSFIKVNLLGGFMSMSITFYVLLIAIYVYKNSKKLSNLFVFILLIAIIHISDIVSYSSFDDRVLRGKIFFDAIEAANVSHALFGLGVLAASEFDKGFSSGLLLCFFETGILGVALIMFIFFKLSQNLMLFLCFIVTSLVIDPARLPLFWMFAILASAKNLRRT